MKNISLIVWITQLGLSVAVPPVGFTLLALWLKERQGWGQWVVWAGIVVGILCAVEGLRSSLKAMEVFVKDKTDKGSPSASFNEHD